MKRLSLILVMWLACVAAVHAQGPLNLVSGSTLMGWNSQGQWSASAGVLATNGSGERRVLTAVPFGDLNLQFEYNQSTALGAKLHLWADKDDNGGVVIDLDRSGAANGVGGIESLGRSSTQTMSEGWHRLQVEASQGQLRVSLDGQPVARASGLGNRAGFLGFEATGAGSLQVRYLTATPLNLNRLFNGSDLSGWKSVAQGPDAKSGVGHTLAKTLSFGVAGGSVKPHDAKWAVQGGAIHGQDGPGSLEYGSQVDDAVLYLSAAVKAEAKPDHYTGLLLRGTPGQMGGGYSVGLGPFAGSIEPVSKRPFSHAAGNVDETVIVAGRTIAVWVGSNLVQVHTDTRAENSNPALGAKTGGGSLALLLASGSQMDVRRIALAQLPRTYGVTARAPAPPPPAPVAPQAPAPAAPTAAETALLQQQQAEAKKNAEDEAKKERSASLMTQALAATDATQQMSLYSQVVQIDPSNAAAVQGFKDAQAKLQAQQSAQQQQQAHTEAEQHETASREQQTNSALVQAQGQFLAGHLSAASTALSTAERLAPDNPLVRDLRSRISSAQSLRSRLYFLGGGAGVLGSVTLLGLWLRRRRQHRYAVLEITRGLDVGRTFPIDKDVVRIGAVPQDGGQKNDFVVQDIEHQISRFHCEIARRNGQIFVTDLRSSNGTRLNGELLKPGSPALLRKGSRITLANSVDLTLAFQRRAAASQPASQPGSQFGRPA